MNPDPVELSPEVKQKINELKEAGVLVPVIPSKEDDLFLLLIKGLKKFGIIGTVLQKQLIVTTGLYIWGIQRIPAWLMEPVGYP